MPYEIGVAAIVAVTVITLHAAYLLAGAVNFYLLLAGSGVVMCLLRLSRMSWELAFIICFVLVPQVSLLWG